MDNLSDVAAERAILASIFQYGKEAYLDCSDLLDVNSFTVHLNTVIYSTIKYIYEKDIEKKIDLPLILSSSKEIGLHNELDGQSKYLLSLSNFSVELENVRDFAKKIKKLEVTRGLLGKIDETARAIRNVTGEESIGEIIAMAEAPLFDFTGNLTGNAQQIEQVSVGLDEYLLDLKNKPNDHGIDIDLPIWQEAVGGLHMGVHIIGARKKTGKTFIAVNAAVAATGKSKVPVLLLDTELSRKHGQWLRLLSRISQVEYDHIKYGSVYDDPKELQALEKAIRILKSIPLSYINITGKAFDEVISIIRRWLMQDVGYDKNGNLNKCLVIYDYLNKVNSSKELKNLDEWMLLGFRANELHDLCSKYGFPVLTFVQLNRELEAAGSDRMSWSCTSYSSFHKKTDEEIAEDGIAAGNRKLIVEDVRYAEGLESGDYINVSFNGKISRIKETDRRNVIARRRLNNEIE